MRKGWKPDGRDVLGTARFTTARPAGLRKKQKLNFNCFRSLLFSRRQRLIVHFFDIAFYALELIFVKQGQLV